MTVVSCHLDTHLWIPDSRDVIDAIARAVEIPDPRWDPTATIRPVGLSPVFVATVRRDGWVGVYRGVARRTLAALRSAGFRVALTDARVRAPVVWPAYRGPNLRRSQLDATERILRHQEGVVVLPTGAGKSLTALYAAAQAGRRTLVVVPREKLAVQWEEEARAAFDLSGTDVGRVYGGSCSVGRVLTFGLPDSVYPRLESVAPEFGTVVFDEAQFVAAPRQREIAAGMPATIRIGVTADHERQDHEEVWTRAVLGPVVFRRTREDAEEAGSVVPVVLRVVPYDSPHLLPRGTAQRERSLLGDEERCALLDRIVLSAARGVVVFVRLVSSVKLLAARWRATGLPVGEMIGRGNGPAAGREFDRARQGLSDGTVEIAVATWSAVGVGTDIPALSSLVLATPPGRGERGYLAYNQNRGRVARRSPGKTHGTTYLLWDRGRVTGTASLLASWNDGRVETTDDGLETWRPAADFDLVG